MGQNQKKVAMLLIIHPSLRAGDLEHHLPQGDGQEQGYISSQFTAGQPCTWCTEHQPQT